MRNKEHGARKVRHGKETARRRAASFMLALAVMASTVFSGMLPGQPGTEEAAAGTALKYEVSGTTTTGKNSGAASVKVSWDAQSGAVKYRIYAGKFSSLTISGSTWIGIGAKCKTTDGTSVTFTGLDAGELWIFKLQVGKYVNGRLVYSDIPSSGNSYSGHSIVLSLTYNGVTNTSHNALGVSCGKITNDYTALEIRYSRTMSFSSYSTKKVSIGASSSNKTVTFSGLPLTTNKVYYVQVRAYSDCKNEANATSDWSRTYVVKITK